MRKVLTTVLATLLVAAGISTATAQQASLANGRGQVPHEMITVMVSREGENKEDFLRRAGGVLSGYTEHTAFEACASVCQAGERTGIWATTSKAHGYCGVSQQCPGGFTSTGESIHSHPQVSSYTVNEVDAVFSGFRDRKGARKRVNPAVFSVHDYDGGSGYLATGGALLFQAGRGTERTIGELIDADPELLSSIVNPEYTASN